MQIKLSLSVLVFHGTREEDVYIYCSCPIYLELLDRTYILSKSITAREFLIIEVSGRDQLPLILWGWYIPFNWDTWIQGSIMWNIIVILTTNIW